MSLRDQRIQVFEDTLTFIDYNKKLSESVEYSINHTNVFYEDDYPVFDTKQNRPMKISVTHERTFESAIRLHKENSESKIAVMNFANAFHPGGGVAKGSGAQEESLCRCSTLYPVLTQKSLKEDFYDYHRDYDSSKATDSLIYTEKILICKTDEDIPQRFNEADFVPVDVITVAAPDLRDESDRYENDSMTDAELFGYHVKRAIHVLTVAAAKDVDILVLGAFGCGAFANDPSVVANAYKTALSVFPKAFDQVVFAVYTPESNTENFDVFKKVIC
jgi:uncharacterized protein (TIGR02452 family)